MKRILIACLCAVIPVLASAQLSKIPQRLEITTLTTEINGYEETQEVFNMPQDGANHYYLSVGHLGIGDEVVQIIFDPVFELFIPLGDTLDEALESLQKLQDVLKTRSQTGIEVSGVLSAGWPAGDLEPVKVVYRKVLLSNKLMFSVERQGYIRATYVGKTDFNALVSGVKFYKRLHPKE